MFGKKQSERMPTRKIWDHVIDVKEGFIPQKREGIPFVKRGKEGSERIREETAEKGIHPAV